MSQRDYVLRLVEADLHLRTMTADRQLAATPPLPVAVTVLGI